MTTARGIMHRPLLIRVLLCLVPLLATSAGAQTTAASADPTTLGGAHGWVLAPWAETEEGESVSMLIHIPPRVGPGAVEAGSGRAATDVRDIEALAAVGRRVYLVGSPAPADEPERRAVFSLRAMPAGVPGAWRNDPDGRLEAHPPLPGVGRLAGVAGAHGSLFALIQRDAGSELLRLTDEGWLAVVLPEGSGEAEGLLVRGDGEQMLLIGTVPSGVVSWRSSIEVGAIRWERLPPVRTPAAIDAASLLVTNGEWITAEADEDGFVVRAWTAAGPADLATVSDRSLLVGLSGISPRLIAVTEIVEEGESPTDEVPARRGNPSFSMLEISLGTGAVFADGRVKAPIPISVHEFRILALALFTLTAAMLLFVLRAPDGVAAFAMPNHTALAESGRRFLATLIDLIPVAIVASRVFGVDPLSVFSISTLLRADETWVALPGALMIGWAYSTTFEGLTGRTLGKLLMSCRVIPPARGEGDAPRAPGMVRSAVRNAVKWFLPPVAMPALFEPATRHRGDGVSNLAVVIEFEADEASGDRGDGER